MFIIQLRVKNILYNRQIHTTAGAKDSSLAAVARKRINPCFSIGRADKSQLLSRSLVQRKSILANGRLPEVVPSKIKAGLMQSDKGPDGKGRGQAWRGVERQEARARSLHSETKINDIISRSRLGSLPGKTKSTSERWQARDR